MFQVATTSGISTPGQPLTLATPKAFGMIFRSRGSARSPRELGIAPGAQRTLAKSGLTSWRALCRGMVTVAMAIARAFGRASGSEAHVTAGSSRLVICSGRSTLRCSTSRLHLAISTASGFGPKVATLAVRSTVSELHWRSHSVHFRRFSFVHPSMILHATSLWQLAVVRGVAGSGLNTFLALARDAHSAMMQRTYRFVLCRMAS
mmetsp:Transcript_2186/g.5479  ORF Transcript_2186/g.5479 Transcript_2186/m.5479 type:complete len:205 (+) Transcript_2186:169-783(+)